MNDAHEITATFPAAHNTCKRSTPLLSLIKKGRILTLAPAVKDAHEITVTFQLLKHAHTKPVALILSPFLANLQGRSLTLAPAVKDAHEITVTFQLPPLRKFYTTKPDHYISHLVGHEGPGSLLSALKVIIAFS